MRHIGILCPPTSGHINPISTLGRALRKRGHRVTMFQLPELSARVEREGLEFSAYGDDGFESGELARLIDQLGRLSGLPGVHFTINCAVKLAKLILKTGPAALRKAGVDCALVDQNEPAGASVVQHVGLPFMSVALLPLNREPDVPPPFVPWPRATNTLERLRNRMAYAAADYLLSSLTSTLNAQRRIWGLPHLHSPDDSFSTAGQLCTMPKSLDFPRQRLPECFHYLGPFLDDARPQVPFPWDRLSGKPIIYASFGTLQNRRREQFRAVAEACAGLDAQLILSAGGGEIGSEALPGSPIVVSYAPQLEILARTTVAITHAGMNTVLEALHCGVPMVAIPVTNDQPAIAARLPHAGAGVVVPFNRVSAARLRESIKQVLGTKSYRQEAQRIQKEIQVSGGVERAAEIFEKAFDRPKSAAAGAF